MTALDIDQLMPTPDETGEPVVEQPPPVDEIEELVSTDKGNNGKGNNK